MKKNGYLILLLTLLSFGSVSESLKAQDLSQSLSLFRLAEGYVRIAEPGVFADTVSVFGDVNAPGQYIIPRGTNIHELIGYARGPVQQRNISQTADWSKLRVEITISKKDPSTGRRTQESFMFRYNEDYPDEFTNMPLGNDYIVSLELRRRPAFVDWLRVISSIAGTTATAILIIDRLSSE
ncbi:hypothetical protein [Rhodohalobacter sp. 614A]|uniref:hypothetical protein n=1 Tax=Rhodohalobacter sp. 614A TaxID=2908649 RepID=UPI001F1DB4D5|nr:hypothetical protein [Rhodohalobacter sp. 614A]